MSNPYLCPYRSLLALFESQIYYPQDPIIKMHSHHVIESQLRKRLSLVLKVCGLPVESITYHALRRSAASIAFNNNVSFEGIKSHGSWQSDAVWQYLFANSQKAREVANMFQSVEKNL